jgi:hypothetical protein
MRKSFLAAATLGATVLSASAFSQVVHTPVDATPYNISIKGMFYWPTDSNLRNIDTLFGGGGLEYLFPVQLIKGSETYMELDFLTHTTSSSNVNVFPLTINQRFYGKQGSAFLTHSGRSFFFLGGGFSWIDPHGQAKLTFHAGVGSELGERIFMELGSYFSDANNAGVRNTGVSLALGYRF